MATRHTDMVHTAMGDQGHETGAFHVGMIEETLEQYISISGESLLTTDRDAWQLYVDRIGQENMRGVYLGDRLVGGLAMYRAGQWFGGNSIACAGVSGVAISPEYRGSKACQTMLRSVLHELYQSGTPIASLYASTQRLYRSVGFEQAGEFTQYSVPVASFIADSQDASKSGSGGSDALPLATHRFKDPPIDVLNRVAEARARRSNGHMQRTHGLWQRLIAPYDGLGTTTYVFGDLEQPQGFVILKPGMRDGGVPQSLVATDCVANTPAAVKRLMELIYSHRALCDRFLWHGSPNDDLVLMVSEPWLRVPNSLRWMLRIVDLPAALSQRGYDESFTGELHLDVKDQHISNNEGRWRVAVRDGTATVERGGEGVLKLSIGALAPLFSSFFNASDLVRCGRLASTDPRQVMLANRMFAGASPWMSEHF